MRSIISLREGCSHEHAESGIEIITYESRWRMAYDHRVKWHLCTFWRRTRFAISVGMILERRICEQKEGSGIDITVVNKVRKDE